MKIRWGPVFSIGTRWARHVCIDKLWYYGVVWSVMTPTGWRWFHAECTGHRFKTAWNFEAAEQTAQGYVTMREAMKAWREGHKIQLAERALEE